MNKDQVIDSFFEVFREVKISNPTFQVDHNLMYYALTRLDTFQDNRYLLCRNEQFHQIIKKDGFFDRWISRFSNSYNTNVFVADNWNYFCQFKSGDVINNNDGEFIKIYVPLDYSHLEEGVNRIFDFMDYNGIKHASKVGSDIRFDDLVIRVTTKEEADAILDFIKNDSYIQEGLLPANPFAFNKNGVALACDGMTSYNSVLSVFLEQFINQNDASSLTSENFYNYLYNFYNSIMNNTIDTKTFILTSFSSKPSVEDFERILVLLINSHDPQFNYDDYLNHFYSGLNHNLYNEQSSANSNNTNIEEVIYNILCIMRQSQDLYESARTLYGYVYTGDEKYLYSIGDIKQSIINSSFRNDALNLLHSSDINFINICYNIVNKYENQNSYENNNEKRTIA